MRRRMLDQLSRLNNDRYDAVGDPEIQSRIAQYEMAYRMQTSVPELTDISNESQATLDLYGDEVKKPGTFAANCLLARRLAERGVRFTQVFIRQWDQHGNLPKDIRRQCGIIDQPCYALIQDLKQRGLLDDTLVIWGGEFGRTIYCQGGLTKTNYGRDHHPRCYTKWMAGAGIKGGRRLRGNRRFQLQRDRESRPHSRFECDDSGSARCQSRTIDFPAPGSRFPPDGCAWKRGSRHSGLRFPSASAPRKLVWKDSLLPRGGNVCASHHGSCQIPEDCAQNSNEISPKKRRILAAGLDWETSFVSNFAAIMLFQGWSVPASMRS